MRALADRHHADLFYSLQLLFEDRLGIDLYAPVGPGWYAEEYWQFGRWAYGDDRLANQFLTAPLAERDEQGNVFDPAHPDRPIRTVTLEQFRGMGDWDYVIASVPDNQHGFARLAKEVGAKYVLQVGNTRQDIDWRLDPLALVSSEMPINGRGVVYHQEFESDTTFGFGLLGEGPLPSRFRHSVRSFVNLMPRIDCGPLMAQYQTAMPDFIWGVFGIDCPGGIIKPVNKLADLMFDTGWGWHDKITGDGFGHVIHQWAAVGRPLIGHASHYRGQMAEPFWQDGVTCIDLDRRSFDENVQLIRDISADPDRHAAMCRAIHATFDSLVNYADEADAIASLLGIKTPREVVA